MAGLSNGGVSSSASEWVDDDDFTEEDLETIEAIFQSYSKKPRREQDLVNGRRLPNSILALQHPDSFSLSPCQGFSFSLFLCRLLFGFRERRIGVNLLEKIVCWKRISSISWMIISECYGGRGM